MNTPTFNIATRQFLALSLSIGLVVPSLSAFGAIYDPPNDDTIQIKGGVSLNVKKGKDRINSLSLRDTDLKDLLYTLAKMGEFNIVVDNEVDGKITVDLKDISIEKAFEYITTLSDLAYIKDGNTLLITKQDKADDKALNKLMLKSLPVRYSNAHELADALNNTVFSIARPGGNKKAAASADDRTNAILIMGNESDIDLAQRAIAELDFPLQHKTILLKNAPAKDVATAISQILFGVSLEVDSGDSSTSSDGSSNGSSSNNNSSSSSNNNSSNNNSSNSNNSSSNSSSSSGSSNGSNSSSSGGSGGSDSGGNGDDATVSAGTGVDVFRGGPMTFIINKANNTLTILGTAEQIQMAENLMYDLDIRPPQVAIQVSVIQVDHSKNKSYDFGLGTGKGLLATTLSRQLGINFNSAGTLLFWNPNNNNPGASQIASSNNVQLSNLFSETDGKILANPTVVAISGTTSTINLTQQIFQGFNTTIVANAQTQQTPIFANVGVTLNITPKVSNNGTVSLAIAPTVSAPSGTVTVDQGTSGTNTFSLISSSTLNIGTARIQDGETLILGGLVQENSNRGVGNKVPFLGDIPIIGSLFRVGNTSKQSRSELIVLVTPHIIKEEGVPYFREEWKQRSAYEPVSINNAPSKLPANTYLMATPQKNTGVVLSNPKATSNSLVIPQPYGIVPHTNAGH